LKGSAETGNLACGGEGMANKPNGCGSILALIAIVFVVGRCVGGDKPADPVLPLGVEQSSPTALPLDEPTAQEVAASPESGNEDQTQSQIASTHEASIATQDAPTWSGEGYVDVDGHAVSSPVYAPTAPDGASAQCRDGTYSFSHHRRGTCSRHGGVAEWL
jgi:hypothetical protein